MANASCIQTANFNMILSKSEMPESGELILLIVHRYNILIYIKDASSYVNNLTIFLKEHLSLTKKPFNKKKKKI